jgi:hypothetical protein
MQVTSQQKDKDMANKRWIEAMKAQKQQETQIAVAKIGQQAQETVALVGSQTQEKVASISADTTKRTKMADAMLKDHEMKSEATMEMFRANPERFMDDQMFRQLMEMMVEQNKQVSEALQSLTESNQQIAKIIMAPVKRIKDKSGKTVGIERVGVGSQQVQ